MSKIYFQKDFITFFEELEQNNHKDWFDVNRNRYHEVIKAPFENFVKDLILSVQKINPKIEIPYNKAIFRINRDVRFSKDKAPYKLNRSALISPNGTKDKTFPGMYFEVNKNGIHVYGGLYMLDAKQVQSVREEILDYTSQFQKIYNNSKFKKHFPKIHGEAAKRIPKEFQELQSEEPLIAQKNWYVSTSLPLDLLYSDKLLTTLTDLYAVLYPFNKFFERPISIAE